MSKLAPAKLRRHVAALNHQVATLEGQTAALLRTNVEKPAADKSSSCAAKVRLVPKGLRAQRSRLELSVADYRKLAGVSARPISNWEQGHTRTRLTVLEANTAKKRRKNTHAGNGTHS